MICGVGEPPDAKVKTPDERHVKDHNGEGDIERPGPIHEDELLDAIDDEGVEPAQEFSAVRGYGAAAEVNAMEGP